MDGQSALIDELVRAVIGKATLRLVYSNLKKKGIVSVHDVAPIDVRPGDTPATAKTLYLWAWCFAEGKPETHTLTRIRRATRTGDTFDGGRILSQWVEQWPLPDRWVVPRSWTTAVGCGQAPRNDGQAGARKR